MSGTVAQPEGITNPPIDDLLETVDSKYGLVLYASRRARQINEYYAQMNGDGLFEQIGPLVDVEGQEKPLSIALREIDARLLQIRDADAEDAPAVEDEGPAPLKLGDDAPEPPATDFSY